MLDPVQNYILRFQTKPNHFAHKQCMAEFESFVCTTGSELRSRASFESLVCRASFRDTVSARISNGKHCPKKRRRLLALPMRPPKYVLRAFNLPFKMLQFVFNTVLRNFVCIITPYPKEWDLILYA